MSGSSSLLRWSGRHSSFRRVLAATLAVTATGCMTWHRVPDRPDALLARNSELVVRLTRHRGPRLELQHPFLSHDTIVGLDRSRSDNAWVTIPLSDVEYVEVQQLAPERTAALVAAAGVTAIAVAIAGSGRSSPPPPPPPSTSGCRTGTCLGSCPYVYSWDGTRWRLDSGTFGGAIARALQKTDVDNLDFATPQGDVLRLRVANELPETDHIDALQVIAVDHDRDVAVAPDPSGELHTLGTLAAPVSARDFRGADALARVREADGWNWESSFSGRDTTRTADLRDGLELAFVRPRGAARAHLVLDGNNSLWSTHLLNEFVRIHGASTQAWYDSLEALPVMAQAVATRFAQEGFLSASIRTASGWMRAGMFGGVGPEGIKRQVLELDLSQVGGDTVFVRLESAPSFWLVDRIAMDFTTDRSVAVHELPLISARDRAGRDVRPLLAAVDGSYYVLHTGDGAELSYRVPEPPAGKTRSFILRSTGWYHIDTPGTGAPDVATLDAVARDPYGIARGSVARLNAAIARFGERAR